MSILSSLYDMQDINYADFQAKLMPMVDRSTIIGVRTPQLRDYAKQLYGSTEANEFLSLLPHHYYDENNLHSFIISLEKDFERAVALVDDFLPYVDNWATCDMMAPKVFKKHPVELYPHIIRWTQSTHTYTIRFGLEMLMSLYLDKLFTPEILTIPASVTSTEYYVNMMLAWFFATALYKQYDAALPYLKNAQLDTWVHNKAIQKAIESNRISDEHKQYLRSLKYKGDVR